MVQRKLLAPCIEIIHVNIPNAWSFIVKHTGSSFQNINQSTCNKFLINKTQCINRCKVIKPSLFQCMWNTLILFSSPQISSGWQCWCIRDVWSHQNNLSKYLNASIQFSLLMLQKVPQLSKIELKTHGFIRKIPVKLYLFSFQFDRLLALPLLLIASVLYPPKWTMHIQMN